MQEQQDRLMAQSVKGLWNAEWFAKLAVARVPS
jgi:hypothetical protein